MKFFLAATLAIASSANLPAGLISEMPRKDQVGEGRIIGGEEAADGEFPYQVSIRFAGNLGSTHYCGGSIIDKDWILTAAWCCFNELPSTMDVVAGGIKLTNFENEEEKRNVEHIFTHPKYIVNNGAIDYDICLLKLKDSLEWTEFVQPIALPAAGQMTETGTECILTGWGILKEGGLLDHTNVLHKVTLPVVSDEDCKADYIGFPYYTSEAMICAGLPEGGKDSCTGDNGGPVVCGEELIGVITWGIAHEFQNICGKPGKPGVHTETSYFIDWITSTMATN